MQTAVELELELEDDESQASSTPLAEPVEDGKLPPPHRPTTEGETEGESVVTAATVEGDGESVAHSNAPSARSKTVLVFDSRRRSRARVCDLMSKHVRMAIPAENADAARATIERCNLATFKAPQTANRDRVTKPIDLIVSALDESTVRLLEWITERRGDPVLGKRPTVPMFLLIDTEAVENNFHESLLPECLEHDVAGYAFDDGASSPWLSRCLDLMRLHSKIEDSYRDLALEETHHYPRFSLAGVNLTGEDLDKDEEDSAAPDAVARPTTTSSASVQSRSVLSRRKSLPSELAMLALANRENRAELSATKGCVPISAPVWEGGTGQTIHAFVKRSRPGLGPATTAAGLLKDKVEPIEHMIMSSKKTGRQSLRECYRASPTDEILLSMCKDKQGVEALLKAPTTEVQAPPQSYSRGKRTGDDFFGRERHKVLEKQRRKLATRRLHVGACDHTQQAAQDPVEELGREEEPASRRRPSTAGARRPSSGGSSASSDSFKGRQRLVKIDSTLGHLTKVGHTRQARKNERLSGRRSRTGQSSRAALAHNTLIRDGILELRRGNVRDVLQQRYITARPAIVRSSPGAYFLIKGFEALEQGGEVSEAVEQFQQAVKREPRSGIAHGALGLAVAMSGNTLAAIANFSSALEFPLCPQDYLAVRFNRSLAFALVGDDDAAVEDLTALLQRPEHQENVMLKKQRALIERRRGNFDQAREDYISLWKEEEKHYEDREELKREREQLLKQLKAEQQAELSNRSSGSKSLSELRRKSQQLLEPPTARSRSRSLSRSPSRLNSASVAESAAGKDTLLSSKDEKDETPDLMFRDKDQGVERPTVKATLMRWRDMRPRSNARGVLDNAAHLTLDVFQALVNSRGDIWSDLFQTLDDVQALLAMAPAARAGRDLGPLKKLLRVIPVFRHLNEQALEGIAKGIEYRSLKVNGTAFVQCGGVNALCVLLSGSMTVCLHNAAGIRVPVGTVKAPEEFGQFEMLLPQDDSEALETFQASEPTELLVVPRALFDEFLQEDSLKELKRRFGVLKRSGLFQGWSTRSVTIVARFARCVSFKRGDVLVEQGENSEFLFLLTRGVCKVSKYPDVCAQVERQVHHCDKALERLQHKYCMHHLLTKSCTKPETPGFLTLGEETKFYIETARQQHLDELEALRKSGDAKVDTQNTLFVGTLMPPGLCGESGILDPTSGMALGSVVAETMVEALALHKTMLQSFEITPDFLDRLRRKARIIYPDDIDIVRRKKVAKEERAAHRRVLEVDYGGRFTRPPKEPNKPTTVKI